MRISSSISVMRCVSSLLCLKTVELALQRAVLVAVLAGARLGQLTRLVLQLRFQRHALVDESGDLFSEVVSVGHLLSFAQCNRRSTDLEQTELDLVAVFVDRLHFNRNFIAEA